MSTLLPLKKKKTEKSMFVKVSIVCNAQVNLLLTQTTYKMYSFSLIYNVNTYNLLKYRLHYLRNISYKI